MDGHRETDGTIVIVEMCAHTHTNSKYDSNNVLLGWSFSVSASRHVINQEGNLEHKAYADLGTHK